MIGILSRRSRCQVFFDQWSRLCLFFLSRLDDNDRIKSQAQRLRPRIVLKFEQWADDYRHVVYPNTLNTLKTTLVLQVVSLTI